MFSYLENLVGCKACTLIAETVPDLIGGNPWKNNIKKLAQVNGMIGWKYSNSVNNQRAREQRPLDESGEVEFFEPLPRKWGNRIQRSDGSLSPLVEHKGEHYLEVKVQKSIQHEYRLADGTVVDIETVKPWLRKKKESKRQRVQRPVILRDYALSNIRQLMVDGKVLI